MERVRLVDLHIESRDLQTSPACLYMELLLIQQARVSFSCGPASKRIVVQMRFYFLLAREIFAGFNRVSARLACVKHLLSLK